MSIYFILLARIFLITFRRSEVSRNSLDKGGGAEYLILNFYLFEGNVKSNVQSIGNIISF